MDKLILKQSSLTHNFVGVRNENDAVIQLTFNEPLAFRKKGENSPSLSGAYIYTDVSLVFERLELQKFPTYTMMFDNGQLIRITNEHGAEVTRLEIPFDADIIRYINVIVEFDRDLVSKPIVE